MLPVRRSFLSFSPCGFHRVVYWEWGPRDALRTAVCVHGLTRNGRDFDVLAAALVAAGWRVICPDVVGRGESDWLTDPRHYGFAQYNVDMTALLARLDVEEVDWIGTSMGGLIAMGLAAQPNHPIRRLVLNDVGPFIPGAALARIGEYLGKRWHWADRAAAEASLRTIHGGFGQLSDAQWRQLTDSSIRPAEGGGYVLRYDPAIAESFTAAGPEDVELWSLWDRITIPVLVLRGVDSDLLLPETAVEMTRRGPPAEVVEFPDCGHAPALMQSSQVETVVNWLRSPGNDEGPAARDRMQPRH